MGRAVVLGGSVAGSLTAGVLSEFFDEVVIVERDELDGVSPGRRGVPQSLQLHGLLDRGLEEMERIYPGLTPELVEGGALSADVGFDCHWYVDGIRKPLAPVGRPAVLCTRPFLERHLRRRALASPGVRLLGGVHVDGLRFAGDRVASVVLAQGEAPFGEPEITADVVIDCTGRSSRVTTWLVEAGFPAVPEEKMHVDQGYATRYFRREPDETLYGAKPALSMFSPTAVRENRLRGGGVFAVEEDRWMLMLGGYADDRPSSDPGEFLMRAKENAAAPMRDVAGDHEPLTDPLVFRFPASVRRDFHRCWRLPEGLYVAGDAVASFNPIYGQGMSCAAVHAAALRDHLREAGGKALGTRAYFDEVAKIAGTAWDVSATEDLRMPHVEGQRPRGLKAKHWVGELVTEATRRDADLHRQFLDVVNLRAAPTSLMTPRNVARMVAARRRPLPAA